jgi:hypothetical protein
VKEKKGGRVGKKRPRTKTMSKTSRR